MKLRPIVLVALLPVAACAPYYGQDEGAIRAPAATAVGEPVDCLSSNEIRNSHVWDDYTIDFETAGGRTYRNTLDARCAELGFEQRFAYETTISRLCSTDIITVLHNDGANGTSCGLGKFVPVQLADR